MRTFFDPMREFFPPHRTPQEEGYEAVRKGALTLDYSSLLCIVECRRFDVAWAKFLVEFLFTVSYQHGISVDCLLTEMPCWSGQINRKNPLSRVYGDHGLNAAVAAGYRDGVQAFRQALGNFAEYVESLQAAHPERFLARLVPTLTALYLDAWMNSLHQGQSISASRSASDQSVSEERSFGSSREPGQSGRPREFHIPLADRMTISRDVKLAIGASDLELKDEPFFLRAESEGQFAAEKRALDLLARYGDALAFVRDPLQAFRASFPRLFHRDKYVIFLSPATTVGELSALRAPAPPAKARRVVVGGSGPAAAPKRRRRVMILSTNDQTLAGKVRPGQILGARTGLAESASAPGSGNRGSREPLPAEEGVSAGTRVTPSGAASQEAQKAFASQKEATRFDQENREILAHNGHRNSTGATRRLFRMSRRALTLRRLQRSRQAYEHARQGATMALHLVRDSMANRGRTGEFLSGALKSLKAARSSTDLLRQYRRRERYVRMLNQRSTGGQAARRAYSQAYLQATAVPWAKGPEWPRDTSDPATGIPSNVAGNARSSHAMHQFPAGLHQRLAPHMSLEIDLLFSYAQVLSESGLAFRAYAVLSGLQHGLARYCPMHVAVRLQGESYRLLSAKLELVAASSLRGSGGAADARSSVMHTQGGTHGEVSPPLPAKGSLAAAASSRRSGRGFEPEVLRMIQNSERQAESVRQKGMSVTFSSCSVTDLATDCLLSGLAALEADPCDDGEVLQRCDVIWQVLPCVAGRLALLRRLARALLLFPALRWHSLRAVDDQRVCREPCGGVIDRTLRRSAGYSVFFSIVLLEPIQAALDACLLLKDASIGIPLSAPAKLRLDGVLDSLDPRYRNARRAMSHVPEFEQIECDIVDEFLSWVAELSIDPIAEDEEGVSLALRAAAFLFTLSASVPCHFERYSEALKQLLPSLGACASTLGYPLFSELQRISHML